MLVEKKAALSAGLRAALKVRSLAATKAASMADL
jgi:hypothetical protein